MPSAGRQLLLRVRRWAVVLRFHLQRNIRRGRPRWLYSTPPPGMAPTRRSSGLDVVDRTVATSVKTDPKAYAETCRMMGAFDLRPQLGRLRMPTRIAVGEEDQATPIEMAKALHAGIAGSELNVIAGGRHLTPLEFPLRVAAEIDLLLEKAAA
jgi:pimeloyl-ACP methyl ester carboxylesterase